MTLRLMLLSLALIFALNASSNAEVVRPIGGALSSSDQSSVKFVNFDCEFGATANDPVMCRRTFTTIEPKLEELLSRDELEAIAERDKFDVTTLQTMCEQLKPFFAFLFEGKAYQGQKITDEMKLQLKNQSLAMGFDREIMGSFKDICQRPSQAGVVDILEQMQLAESRVCKVDSFTTKAEPYSLDLASGKWISSEIVDGICDQYVYTEVITLDEFGLGTIEKYEVKKTFVQQRLKGADREFACDLPGEWDDKVYVSKQVYFPMSCVSLVRN